MAKKTRSPRQSKVPAEEQELISKLDTLRDKTKDRAKTDAEKKSISEINRELGAMRFIRVAKMRGAKAITAIRNLGKLSGGNYTRTPEQVAKLMAQITSEVKACEAAMLAVRKGKEAIEIKL